MPDKLYRRERQLIAEASAKACAMGAFSISFVAKKSTVKAIIYLQQPSYSTARAADVPQEMDAELGDDVIEPAPPAPAAAPQRPPPRPTPVPARSTPPLFKACHLPTDDPHLYPHRGYASCQCRGTATMLGPQPHTHMH